MKFNQTMIIKIESKPDGTQKLTIADAKQADTDEYRCVAEAKGQKAETQALLSVKESKPIFVKVYTHSVTYNYFRNCNQQLLLSHLKTKQSSSLEN